MKKIKLLIASILSLATLTTTALAQPVNPQTGDEADLTLWFILGGVAVVGGAVALILVLKKKNS